jgi:hypothetical protein
MAAVGRREATDTALPKARSRSIAWMRAFMGGFANLADIDKKIASCRETRCNRRSSLEVI